ncbi:DEAD-box ATP-dependent RNA helicase 7-like [Phragmites australis]|uniref:DEAD-box ATP-dependent RNA helicase 7-like n=1 Tax=Phragmites australis TaxID=29695 RepID=UPI002D7A09E3|nr:DEAD-box ATP-dependent RNA helicase 7-like [Phragmites australis]
MSPALAAAEPMAVDDSASKKAKRKQLKAAATAAGAEAEAASARKKEKKRKAKEPSPPPAAAASSDEERSSTSSEESAPAAKKAKKEKKTVEETSRSSSGEDDGELTTSSDEDPADPNALTNFRISEPLRQRLRSKGIKALFPIQATTFDLVLDGSDLVGRARTGQGKTLAFVLPILESLVNGAHKVSRKTDYGRPPSVLVLLPTRELANQVHADFEFYGATFGLSACCVYGGSPYRPQEMALRKGVDIVVGTPGRIKDFVVKGTLNLKSLKFRVLDEADEMLNMGFVDDVELILGKVEDVTKVQTLLFSATLPDWVNKLSMRFLKVDRRTVDLVGNEKLKASASVKHLALPCNKAARAQVIPDIIRCYSHGGRTIIFTETKDSASELSGLIAGSRALHGDVVQAQREVILAGFRSGKFQVLVATNVAARGLDINDVQLIIQCEPPRDVEAYIHRSGRTGRAGNTGVAVMLFEPRYKHSVTRLERESGVKFQHISAPQPTDVAQSAGSEAADAIASVSDSVIPVFRQQAEQLLNSSTMSAVDLLAKALAKAVGYTDIKKRSLLSSMEDYTTLHLQTGRPMWAPGFAFTILKTFMPEEKLADVKGATLTADGTGVVFDVPAADVEDYIQGSQSAAMVTIGEVKQLPPLQEKEQSRGNSGGGRFGRGGGGRFSGGGRGRGGGGRGFSGRGGGGNRFNRRN